MDERPWLERIADAAETQANTLASILSAKNASLSPEAPRPGTGPLRRLFGGERGAKTLLRALPDLAELFEKPVPAAYVLKADEPWKIVSCVCGASVGLSTGAIAECFCERFFFATNSDVRVHRFDGSA